MSDPRDPVELDDAAGPEAAPDAAPEPELEPQPEPAPAQPFRRRGVGPFSLRQVTIAILVVMGTAIVLTLATVPLGSTEPGLPVPDPSAFLIGSPIPGLSVGDLAPELEGAGPDGTVQLADLDGTPIRLSDLRGKAVWINFWASWCPPCQVEIPVVRDVAARYAGRGLVVLGISVQEASVSNVAAYAARYQLDYTIAADVTGDIYRLYRPPGLPTSIFIGPEGAVRSFVLAPLTEAGAMAQIEPILPGASPTSSAHSSENVESSSPTSSPG